MKLFHTCLIGLSLSGCAATAPRTYFFDEIAVINRSRAPVTDVTIRDVKNDRLFSCGNVAPFGICANRFAQRPHQRNPIQITWTIGGNTRQSREFQVDVPAGLDPGTLLRGMLEITPTGDIGVYLRPAGRRN